MRGLGAGLIVAIGLLTFHPPHFLLETERAAANPGEVALEVGLGIDLFTALAAAVGIWRGARWGWVLGLVVAVGAVGLYVVQQTLGLPGLPKNWAEPSRLFSLAIQVLFIVLAARWLLRAPTTPPGRETT